MKKILKIKNHHLEKGITNSFLAEKAGVNIGDLYELDNDHIFYRKNFITRISEVLKTHPENFVHSYKAKTG